MSALEDVLPAEVERDAVLSGQEFALTYLHSQRAVELAFKYLIAMLGIDSCKIFNAYFCCET